MLPVQFLSRYTKLVNINPMTHGKINQFNWKENNNLKIFSEIVSASDFAMYGSNFNCSHYQAQLNSKLHVANMGPTGVLSAPSTPHVGPMNFAISEFTVSLAMSMYWRRQSSFMRDDIISFNTKYHIQIKWKYQVLKKNLEKKRFCHCESHFKSDILKTVLNRLTEAKTNKKPSKKMDFLLKTSLNGFWTDKAIQV